MQHRFVTLSMIFVVSLLVCAPLSSCGRRDEEHPAASLQRLLVSRLADPAACPGGGSQDIQSVIDAAGSDGVAYLPEGCYRIEETVNLPSCISLIGAGADKTILYRHPGGS